MKISTTILVTSLALTILSCQKSNTETGQAEPVIPVKVNTISNTANGVSVSASGKIEAAQSATITTRLMGYITRFPVTVGQKVAAGQLLVNINNTDLQAKKAQAEAQILQATAAFNSAKKDYDRFVKLFAQQSASQKELDDMTARFEMTKAALEGARQMKSEVVSQFAYSNITAPFSGTVTATFAKSGDMANPGQPLLTLEGKSGLQVVAMVSENDIPSIKNDMEVKILVKSSNQSIVGKVSEISGSAKNTGGQYLVKINLPKAAASILPGMFVNVAFPVQAKVSDTEKITIPLAALIRQGQLSGVYVVTKNNTALLRWLRTGKTFGDQIEVLSGLSANETYILSADGKLYNGAKVSRQ